MQQLDLVVVCDLAATPVLPNPRLQLLEEIVTALPEPLLRHCGVFLFVGPEEQQARALLVPWVESFGLRCHCIALAQREPAARALAMAQVAELDLAPSVLLLDGLGPAGILRDLAGRRGRCAAVLLQPALLRLAMAATPSPALQAEAALERHGLALLDALWLPAWMQQPLAECGAALPATTLPFHPPCLLAEGLLPWLSLPAAGAPPEAPPAEAGGTLLRLGPLRLDSELAAFLEAVARLAATPRRPRRLSLIGPCAPAALPALRRALAALEARTGLPAEAFAAEEPAGYGQRFAEPAAAAVVAATPEPYSEALELCRRLSLPTLAADQPLFRRQAAATGFAPHWSPPGSAPEPEALARLLDEAASRPRSRRRARPAPGQDWSALARLLPPPGEVAAEAPPAEPVAVALRGAADDPALQHTLLSLQQQSRPVASLLLLEEAAPPEHTRLPRLLLPPSLPPAPRLRADDPAAARQLAQLPAERLLLLRAGDVLPPTALERLAALPLPAEAGLLLPTAAYDGALFPNFNRADFAGLAPEAEAETVTGRLLPDPLACDRPLLLPRALLERRAPIQARPCLGPLCLRRVPATAAAAPAETAEAEATEAAPAGATAPERRLRRAAAWLQESEAELPPWQGWAPPPAPAGSAPAAGGQRFRGLLLGYTPRCGAAALLSGLRGQGRLGVVARDAFSGVPGRRQGSHLALLRAEARGWRRRRVALRARLDCCADPLGLAEAVQRYDWAVVVLLRLNQVRQVVSELNAEHCRRLHGVAHPYEPPPLAPLQLAAGLLEERLLGLAEGQRHLEAALAPLLRLAPERVLLLPYEQWAADPSAALGALCGLLGLAPRPLRPALRRLTPQPLHQALADHPLLLRHYRGSGLAAQLRDGGESSTCPG